MITELKIEIPGKLDKFELEICKYFTERLVKNLEKYRKGVEEHGNTQSSVDCAKEIGEEVKDIINYHCMDKVNKAS